MLQHNVALLEKALKETIWLDLHPPLILERRVSEERRLKWTRIKKIMRFNLKEAFALCENHYWSKYWDE